MSTYTGMVRVLGVDPGSRLTGWGIVDSDGRKSAHVASGVLKVGTGEVAPRLRKIFVGLSDIIAEWDPAEVAIERVFLARNPDSALKLGQARGAAICAATVGGLSLSEYSAKEVKLATVGTGSAGKEQVQHMVKLLLKLAAIPQEDEADALAVALCHAHSRNVLAKVSRGGDG